MGGEEKVDRRVKLGFASLYFGLPSPPHWGGGGEGRANQARGTVIRLSLFIDLSLIRVEEMTGSHRVLLPPEKPNLCNLLFFFETRIPRR